MENASKALLIAAGILVGMIIISLFVYELAYAATVSKAYQDEIAKTEIRTFNTQFEKYLNRPLKAQEVATLYNYVHEWNYGGELSEGHPSDMIEIKFKGVISSNYFKTKTVEEFLIEYPQNEYYFECTDLKYRQLVDEQTGRIYEITITCKIGNVFEN